MPSSKPVVRIVTPGTREANNGNWRTATRWAAMLRDSYRVIVQTRWSGEAADVLLALHAKRSADSILAFRERCPGKPVGLVLTGTDLYRDLPHDRDARESLRLAEGIVVLQDDALRFLPPAARRKAVVIFQSARVLRPAAKAKNRLNAVVVGHLREEKDPATLLRTIELLPRGIAIRVTHIGAPLDGRLARAASRLAERDPRYRWVGALPHGLARAAIQRAHVLVHPSRVEGGANVIAEAIVSGTPVIATRMSGNIGMLGKRYPGLFPVGDAEALASMLERALREPAFLGALRTACAARKPLFRPGAETAGVHRFVRGLLM